MQHSYEVRPAREGLEAIAADQLDPPDLILLDVKMPVMDGIAGTLRINIQQPSDQVMVQ